MKVFTWFCAWVAAMVAVTAHAQLPVPGRNAISAELIAETAEPAAGSTVTLALVMKPDKGWHGYWKNPGDSGIETQVEWRLPPGVEAGALQYPVPGRLVIAGLMNYVYEGDYAHLIALKLPSGLAQGTRLPIRGKVDFLACTDEICVPQTANVALDLTVGQGGARNAAFDGYRQALPRPLGAVARFEQKDGRFRLAIPFPQSAPLSDPYFYPVTDGALAYAKPQAVTRNGDRLIVETEAGIGVPGPIEGVLATGEGGGLSFAAIPGPVPPAGEAVTAQPGVGADLTVVLVALGGALLGGLLLNIMPCVFPILSLKALSLAKTGGDEAAARREALAYTVGVVLVCLALGGLLLGLRAGGAAVGWAFQLQDPRIILVLLLLVTAIALNLAGLFELPAVAGGGGLAGKGGTSGAFWTGALAAFVATPCTGPFMGAALGAALVLPAPVALAIFAGLGVGMALPFLLLGFIPALRRRLPRPGPWLDRFRKLMAIPMFLTALALAWVLGRQAGVDGMALGLAAALVLALSLWWFGRRTEGARAWLPLVPAALATVAAIVVIPSSAPTGARTTALAAEPFSESRLAALQAERRPVFVYFTADWCITCKVNEKGALQSADVTSAFKQANVAVLAGDWTQGDPAITRFLEKHGRSGVPLYLFYRPGRPVQILPQVLTGGLLTELAA